MKQTEYNNIVVFLNDVVIHFETMSLNKLMFLKRHCNSKAEAFIRAVLRFRGHVEPSVLFLDYILFLSIPNLHKNV